MSNKERQPDSLPTNKAVTAGSVAAVVSVYFGPAVAEVWPQVVPGALAGPDVTQLVSALAATLAGLAVAWWVPDRAGIPVGAQ